MRAPVYLTLGFLLLYVTACGVPSQPQVTVSFAANGPVIELAVRDAQQRLLQLGDGARFKLYKGERLLQEALLREDQIQLSAVTEEPPYRYSFEQARVVGLAPARGVPIDTQGGLANRPAMATPMPLPAELRQPSGSPGQSFSGIIETDLRSTTPYILNLSWLKP